MQADNEALKETANNLDSDFKKKSTDFLALTKKLHTEHLEHQKIVKQLNDFREPLILEERKLRREEKASRKQKAKAKQEKTKSDVSEDPTLGDDDFHCTICAQTFPKSELSSKSVPEESDTCKTCNNHEFDTIETLDEELEPNTKPTEDSTRQNLSLETLQVFHFRTPNLCLIKSLKNLLRNTLVQLHLSQYLKYSPRLKKILNKNTRHLMKIHARFSVKDLSLSDILIY